MSTTTEKTDKQAGREARLAVEDINFRQLAETIPHLVWSARADGVSDYYNSSFLKFLGKTLEEMHGWTWAETLHPDDRQRSIDNWTAAFTSGSDYCEEYRIRRAADGRYVWHEGRAKPLRDTAGKIVRWFGTCTEIKERKRAEAKQELLVEAISHLLTSQEPQHAIETLCHKVMAFLDCQFFFNFLVDEERGRLCLNACAGISKEEERKIHWLDYGVAVCGCAARDVCRIVAEDIQSTPDPRTELVKSYGVRAYACHPMVAQGRVLGTLSFGTSTRDHFSADDLELMKTVAGHVAIALERKRIELLLRDSEELYRAIGESIDYGVWVCDPEGRNTYASPSFLKLVGLTQEQCSNFGWGDVLHPDDAEDTVAAWKECTRTGSLWNFEHRYRGVDGEWHPILARGVPVRDDHGNIRFWAGINLDIAEFKKVEEALAEAKLAAEKASQAKSDFLANMSHDIRTPMTVFLMALEQLQQIELEPVARKLLELADKSAKALRELVDDVLDISQIEACRVKLSEEAFTLRFCVRDLVEMFSLAAQEKRLSLTESIAPEVPPVIVADQCRLRQVLINLLGNALKFTNQGGVEISVSSTGEALTFAIADTGIGIPEDKQHLLFQSFSQVDNSFHRQHGGSGLGLAICKGLVELMGGTISMRNREGGGSIFTFTLPLKTVAAKTSPNGTHTADLGSLSARPVRILLAEDESMVRDIVSLALTHHGWNVETAVNGREAIAKWRSEPFDVILMDLQMPEINGLEAARTIRAGEAGPGRGIAIIGFTAHTSERIIEDCIAAGMNYVLSKPLHFDDLSEVINQCLADKSS
ncbi:MAG: PAS domain-containing protein [Desulfuromonadales bacterium]|nr:PAS domain-containing protein [Desulfuromonadales bacterium]